MCSAQWVHAPDTVIVLPMQEAAEDATAVLVANRSGGVLGPHTILKEDHFPGCQSSNLPPILPGVPNFRGVGVSTPLTCCHGPSAQGQAMDSTAQGSHHLSCCSQPCSISPLADHAIPLSSLEHIVLCAVDPSASCDLATCKPSRRLVLCCAEGVRLCVTHGARHAGCAGQCRLLTLCLY